MAQVDYGKTKKENIVDEEIEFDQAEALAEKSKIRRRNKRIGILTAERDELRDRFMRALADAENARKRSERDRREAENYGGSKLARDMLPVYDNLARALDVIAEDPRRVTSDAEGIELTMKELLSVFGKHGIEPIAPEIGDRFDPQVHEAMFEAPVPETKGGRHYSGLCRRVHPA